MFFALLSFVCQRALYIMSYLGLGVMLVVSLGAIGNSSDLLIFMHLSSPHRNGNVAQGALDMLKELQVVEVKPQDLPVLVSSPGEYSYMLYICCLVLIQLETTLGTDLRKVFKCIHSLFLAID